MEIKSDAEWDAQEDREVFKAFLATRTGQRLIPKLLDSSPALLAKGDVNEIMIRTGEARGWSAVIQTLIALAVGEPQIPAQPAASAYPDLESDGEWNDGKTLK